MNYKISYMQMASNNNKYYQNQFIFISSSDEENYRLK